MKTTLHKAAERGYFTFGWFETYLNFSFGEYYDPEKINFGAIQAVNEDVFHPNSMFPSHLHENMEIACIILQGNLTDDGPEFTDVLKTGEVQLTSSGSGFQHMVKNESWKEDVILVKVWYLPRELNVAPRTTKMHFDKADRRNKLQTLVSPDEPNTLHTYQDAWLSRGDFDEGLKSSYHTHLAGHGVYVLVLEGSISIEGQVLNRRDTLAITDAEAFSFRIHEAAELLFVEVPMDEHYNGDLKKG